MSAANHLLRRHAPITEAGWAVIDEEARQRLVAALAARKVVDFDGPRGWSHSASNLGRSEAIAGPSEGVSARRRLVLPLVELRVAFEVSLEELFDAERGAIDVDLSSLDRAAHRIAAAENTVVFHGFPAGGLKGIAEATPYEAPALGGTENYPTVVAGAVELLLRAGIAGPYALVVEPDLWTRIVESAEASGHLLLDHLRSIVGGPVVWAPGVTGAAVVSMRGGDFLLESGEDLSVGYWHHDASTVQLYLEETFSFRIASPDAAVTLRA
jgi:uncharacterized linocin/CFP29 family protein